MRRAVLVSCVAVAFVSWIAAVTPCPAETTPAFGEFAGKNWSFDVGGAYAFPAEVGFDDEQGIKVAVSNAGFRPEVLDRFYDREWVIDNRFADEETLVVYFHFGRDGSYKGMSYFFGSGDGCGFCMDGDTKSTVKVAAGRLTGKLVLAPKEGENSWHIDFDVPIASSDYGKPLPAGGGDVGAVYAAYHQALVAGDGDGLAKVFIRELAARLSEDKDRFVGLWLQDHPTESYKVTKGFIRDDRALLLVDGENSFSKVQVEAHFVKEDGVWKIDDEVMQVKMGDD